MKQFSYIRSLFDDIAFQNRFYNRFIHEHELTPAEREAVDFLHREAIHKIRDNIRRYYKGRQDPLQESLTVERRRASNGNDISDAWTEFWIIPDQSMTDDDAQEICEEETIRIYSPYDCTGKLHTRYIKFTRVPIGYAFIHDLGIDL